MCGMMCIYIYTKKEKKQIKTKKCLNQQYVYYMYSVEIRKKGTQN